MFVNNSSIVVQSLCNRGSITRQLRFNNYPGRKCKGAETEMGGYLKEVNIKSDMPTADDAVRRITYNIRNGKSFGAAAVKIIHGYGSTGQGGKIRVQARKYLQSQKNKGLIKDFIPGEDFSIFDERTIKAFQVCDELRRDSDLERHNNGITIVIL